MIFTLGLKILVLFIALKGQSPSLQGQVPRQWKSKVTPQPIMANCGPILPKIEFGLGFFLGNGDLMLLNPFFGERCSLLGLRDIVVATRARDIKVATGVEGHKGGQWCHCSP